MKFKLPSKEKLDTAIRQSVQESMSKMRDELRDNIATWDGASFNAIKVDRDGSISIGGQFTKGPYSQHARQDETEIHPFTCPWCGTHDTTRNLRGQLECCGCAHPVEQIQKRNRDKYSPPSIPGAHCVQRNISSDAYGQVNVEYNYVMNFNVENSLTDEDIYSTMLGGL